jgi:hypothetical protein
MSEDQNIPSESLKEGVPDGNSSFPEDKGAPVVQPEPGQIPVKELQSETNMEVHHHSHDHGRRSWKSYFWEFLMLFLAVFCGFLAEYQLEHLIEHQREKQYMESFVHDLQGDITNLKDGFPPKDERLSAIDSVFIFFEANPDAQKVPGYVIKQMRRTLWDRRYRRNSTTIDQLKNAGGLRLIRKSDVRDSIAEYDLKWHRAEFWVEKYDLLQEKGKDYLHNIMDANSAMHEYRKHRPSPTSFYYSDSIMTLIRTDQLSQYLNFLNDQKITTAQDKINYLIIEQSAERLAELIKQEYHLE